MKAVVGPTRRIVDIKLTEMDQTAIESLQYLIAEGMKASQDLSVPDAKKAGEEFLIILQGALNKLTKTTSTAKAR